MFRCYSYIIIIRECINLCLLKLQLLKLKVKQSCYMSGMAQRVLRKLRFPDFMTTAQDGGKILGLTHRPPLPPGNAPGTHLC